MLISMVGVGWGGGGSGHTLIEQRQMNLSEAILMVNVNERQGLHTDYADCMF